MSNTVGPWTVRRIATGYGIRSSAIKTAKGDILIAVVHDNGSRDSEADAKLIAAAPELLDAAIQALELLHKGVPCWGVAKDILNAAIHKAQK